MPGNVEQEHKSKFDEAVQRVNRFSRRRPEILLEMYGLYKQDLEGDVTGKQPRRLNMKARYKFNS